MTFIVLVSLALTLSAAAIFASRMALMTVALAALAVVLVALWGLLVLSLGDLSAHYESSRWPSPLALAFCFFVGYAIVLSVAVVRKSA